MAIGGSTNAVLHFLAIAHAAGVAWTIDDFERVRRRVPVLCDLKPSGRYLAVDLHRAGGIPQVMKLLLDAGLLHGECMTITGRTVAETLADVPAVPRPDQDVIRPISSPLYAQGHLAILKGNLSPEGAVAKITGLKTPTMTGPARVFEDEQTALAAILARRHPAGRRDGAALPRAPRRPGHAGDARADERPRRPGARRERRARHGRPVLGRHLGHGRRPRRARGVRGRQPSRSCRRETRSPSTPGRSRCGSRSRRTSSRAAAPPGGGRRLATPAACWRSSRGTRRARAPARCSTRSTEPRGVRPPSSGVRERRAPQSARRGGASPGLVRERVLADDRLPVTGHADQLERHPRDGPLPLGGGGRRARSACRWPRPAARPRRGSRPVAKRARRSNRLPRPPITP